MAMAQSPGEAILENKALRMVAAPGQPSVAVFIKSDTMRPRMNLAILAKGGAQAEPIGKAEVTKNEAGKSVLRVTAGNAVADLSLGLEGYVKINPGANAASVEVRTAARYAVLPDFFADDVVFDPARFSMPSLTVPAENFLLQFLEGGDTIVMCDWAGRLKETKDKDAAASAGGDKKEGRDPQVDLVFAGEGKARRVAAARIEFQDQPVYAGILERKSIWHDEDATPLPTYKPTPISWKRPFEARWRGDFVVANGQRLADWPTRNQSFDFKNTGNAQSGSDPLDARFTAATSSKRSANWWETGLTWWEKGDANAPQIWQESLASFFIYPAVFKEDEVRLCLYADKAKRNQPHVYERVIIYPLGRVAGTPLNVFTPIDLMRETLGQGPCEYILDVAGINPRKPGGDRQTLAYATCGLWDYHIQPIVQQLKTKPDGGYEKLDDPTKTHLIQALDDMWYFVHAVHDRLREYKAWGAEMDAYCKQESAKSPAIKAIADQTLAQLDRLNADIARHKFEGPGSEAYWKDRVPELIQMVKSDNYADLAGISKIRDLGDQQDERVSRCRQYVKAIVQETIFQDTSDPGARAFATEIRDRCHQMLRNQHPKEGF
ncbi:MAG TPA: hypothetical protein VH370_22415 [Humisphaera sp.]|jgi:hypothetical protein|nr:hypothetical protein [Humisphaera sp.]